MLVKCDLCGGENRVHPGQSMMRCSYCGSALTVEDGGRGEQLILPHQRNDRTAEDVLESFLLKRNMGRAKNIRIKFAFAPFFIIEDQDGGNSACPSGDAPSSVGPMPDPPAGDYCYFDQELAGGEKIIRPSAVDPDASRIIYLPVYDVSFNLSKRRWKAAVIGESWWVQIDRLPPRKAEPLDKPGIIAAGALFAGYLFLGRLAGGTLPRLVLLGAAAAAGFLFFKLRGKLAASNE